MPAGLGIYWIATSVVTIIQQLIVNAYMDKVNIDDMIARTWKRSIRNVRNRDFRRLR